MSTLTDASAFLRKRKDKRRALGAFPRSSNDPPRRPIPSTAHSNLSGRTSSLGSPANAASPAAGPSKVKDEVKVETPNPNVVEIKLFSGNSNDTLRWNMAKFNSIREFDPAGLETPLFTRKTPGPRPPPVFAQDTEGNIRGKYVYTPEGQPVLGENGAQVIEPTDGRDENLIGGVDPRKAGRKKAVKEIYNQDKEKMRLKREEALPWVLESGATPMPADGQEPAPSMQWVGRLQEATTLPSVLLINDGESDGFKVVPLGRTYRFEPDRPFNVNDPDEANRLYEYQVRHRIYDRWGNAPTGASAAARPQANGGHGLAMPGRERDVKPKIEELHRQEERAQRWERQLQLDAAAASAAGPSGSRAKQAPNVQRWDDDEKREGRKLTRGMEGGVDEELDYDVNEEFQDDEDVNTFYRDPEEEEEAKLQEERQKKEYRLANANVGDKPQIEDDLSDEEDLFGENELTVDGKKLKRMMKKRRNAEETDDLFGSDSDDSDESEPESKPETPKKPDISRAPSAGPSSSERSSRPPSRTHNRGATSPAPRRPGAISGGKAVTAPPGSGHSLAAQRAASRGASPRRSRGNSPASGRAASPDDRRSPGVGPREGSPATGRGMSPAASVGRGSPARETSPAVAGGRASPAPSASGGPSRPSPAGKRKQSPAPQGDPSRKKKKSSTPRGTPGPEDITPFPGMIQRADVIAWFRTQPALVPMTTAIGAWKDRILAAPTKEQQTQNQGIFLSIVSGITEKEPNKMLRMKAEFRQ